MMNISLEIQRVPRKYNRTLYVSGVDKLTPEVMGAIAAECKKMASLESDEKKNQDWKSLGDDALEIQEYGLCPSEGVKVLGPYLTSDALMPEKGDKVSIAKGADISSTHPDSNLEDTVSLRKQTVTVRSVHGGYVDKDRETKIVDPTVKWSGAGSYWRWTSIANIEENKVS